MKQLALAAVLGGLVALSACGGDEEPIATATTTVTAEVSTTVIAAPTSAAPAPTDDTTFRIGETVSYTDGGSMGILSVKNPTKGQMYDTPSRKQKFVSIELKQCAPDAAGEQSTFVGEWFFLDSQGGEYSSVRTMHGWPTPEFPQFIQLGPAQCKSGWMALELKEGVRFKSVLYRLSGSGPTVAEWVL